MRNVELTPRETEIAERIAWGASIKEVAYDLKIKYKTVDNTLQKIYKKTECGKLNELSAWYFCTRFNISFDLSPMARSVIASFLLGLYSFGEIYCTTNNYYRGRTRRNRIELVRTIRRYN